MKLLTASQDELVLAQLEATYDGDGEFEVVSTRSLDEALAAIEKDAFVGAIVDEQLGGDSALVLLATLFVEHRHIRPIGLLRGPRSPYAFQLEEIGVTGVVWNEDAGEGIRAALRGVGGSVDLTTYPRASEEEVAFLQGLLAQSPTNPQCCWLLGFAMYRRLRYEEAQRFLLQVLDLQPNNLRARYYLGSTLYRLKQGEAARAHWEEVARKDVDGKLAERAREHLDRLKG